MNPETPPTSLDCPPLPEGGPIQDTPEKPEKGFNEAAYLHRSGGMKLDWNRRFENRDILRVDLLHPSPKKDFLRLDGFSSLVNRVGLGPAGLWVAVPGRRVRGMHPEGRRKCSHCKEFFLPDPRNRYHQRYCGQRRVAGRARRQVSANGKAGLRIATIIVVGKGRESARLAGGASRLLEAAPRADGCVTRCLDYTSA